MPKIAELTIEITNNANKATHSLNNLKAALNEFKESKKNLSFGEIDTSGLRSLYTYINSVQRIFEPLSRECENITSAFKQLGLQGVSGLARTMKKAEELKTKMAAISPSAGQASNGLENVARSARKIEQAATKAVGSSRDLAKTTRGLGSAAKGATSGLTGLIKQFGRLFKLKVMRQIVRNVMEGFTEGAKNLYEYSRALESLDSASFKNTMDGYATAFLQLKNSVAAAVAPLLQQFLPVIQQVVAWVIRAIELVNQFFSALQGKTTYTRATNYMVEWGDAVSDASGKAKELERTLLGFDEINKLNDPSKGSGSGSSSNTPDYSSMFEEAEIESGINNVLKKIKPLLDAVKRISDSVKRIWENGLVQAIVKGAAILTLDSLTTALDLVADALDVISSILDGDIPGAIRKLGIMYLHLVANALTTIRDFGLSVLNVLDNLGTGLFTFVKRVIEPVQHSIVDYVDRTVTIFIKGFWSVLENATNSINGIIRAINNSGIAKAMGIHFDEIEYDFGSMSKYSIDQWHKTTEKWKIDTDLASDTFHDTMDLLKNKFGGSMSDMISKMRQYEDVWNLVMDGNWDAAIELYTQIENQNASTGRALEDNPLDIYADNTPAMKELSDTLWSINNSYASVNIQANTAMADKSMWNFYRDWNNTSINLNGNVTVPSKTGTYSLSMFADGGYPDYGTLFIAGESGAGAEMVGNINGRTGVASQGEITGIREAVDASSQREAELLAEQNALLKEIASKSGGEISVNSIMSAMNRVNRRSGRAVVQMG